MSICTSCGATITWMVTNTGAAMPVDGAPEQNGKFDHKKHVSHFATCPNAARHRKTKASKQ